MGLKKQGKGPFRGKTPSNTFQTVDFMSGNAAWIRGQAKRFPQRKYAAVEPDFGTGDLQNQNMWRLRHEQHNLHASKKDMLSFIEEMKQKNERTRYINIDMPYPSHSAGTEFRTLFRETPHILFPNGKIFIASESLRSLQELEKNAKTEGLRTRFLKPFLPKDQKRLTTTMTHFFSHSENQRAEGIHRLEITFGLKKAVPNKSRRKKWPQAEK